MEWIFLTLTLLILTANLAALALFFNSKIDCYALSKITGVFAIALIGFFAEHFIGFGTLHWLWPITTPLSCYLLYQRREEASTIAKNELVFCLGLAYGLAWRVSFPDIDGSTEAFAKLYSVGNYYVGATLPPPDQWLPGYSYNTPDTFLHYMSALLGRLFGWQLGFTYNLTIAVVIAMFVSLVWELASLFCRSKTLKMLLLLSIVAGGTGVSVFSHFIFNSTAITQEEKAFEATHRIWSSVRFIGSYENEVDTRFGDTLVGESTNNVDLPLETIGYITSLGLLSTSMGGLLLLLMAITCIYKLETTEIRNTTYYFVLFATLPLVLITHSAVVIPQSVLLIGWLVYRSISKQQLGWKAIFAGVLVPLFLSLPYLGSLPNNLNSSLEFTNALERTPARSLLILFWPLIILSVLALFDFRKHKILLFFVLSGFVLFVLSELIFYNDQFEGRHNRYTTTLHWWTWLQAYILLCMAPVLIGSKSILTRALSVISLAAIAIFAADLGQKLVHTTKPSFAKLNGHSWLSSTPEQAEMLNYLQAAPKGIILENVKQSAYSNTSALALFSNQPSLNGWPSFVSQSRNNPSFVTRKLDKTKRFFNGSLEHSLAWLDVHDVDYIIWRNIDLNATQESWELIDSKVAEQFSWLSFSLANQNVVGIWIRKSKQVNN